MEFSNTAYRGLLDLLRTNGYEFTDYHSWQTVRQPVILRHDIDFSLDAAVNLSRVELEEGVASTWFVLLRTDFYNIFTSDNLQKLRALLENGGGVGLHFDESQYSAELVPLLESEDDSAYREKLCCHIQYETRVLSELLGTEIRSVAMHCPSRTLLDKDIRIPGMVNTYGQTFFKDFKYLSDSRMNWREDVERIVSGRCFSRLQILTHAFWYGESGGSMRERLMALCRNAAKERYRSLDQNFSDLDQVFCSDEL